MDNFKLVNDSLGHAAGDQLLQQVAERLRRALREGDTVARFGGDEFTILLDALDNPAYALNVAARIIAALQEPFLIEGQTIYTSPSIGIAFSREGEQLADELLRQADAAMFEAKKKGRACFEVFREGLSDQMLRCLQLGNDLRVGIARGELVLHYQPKIELDHRTHLRCGGAGAVESSHPRDDSAERVHSNCRADGADKPTGSLGAARGLPAGTTLAGCRH